MSRVRLGITITSLLLFAAPVFADVVGDLNCDGLIDCQDADAFSLALLDPDGYADAYPACSILLADVNTDGLVDGDDVGGFLDVLAGADNGPIATQLAGLNINQYPYFEYSRAFNKSGPVRVGIDPAQLPCTVGKTGHIYVVAAKTDVEWADDPTLVDETNLIETITITGSTIEPNRKLVATAGELGSNAFTDIGKPYDVVIDFNQNGVLDSGDLIDGLGDAEAGLYVMRDMTTIGTLDTATISYNVSGITSGLSAQRTVYPADIETMGQLPLVVISHGNGHNYTWYDYLQQHLASYGYIVMSHQNDTVPGIENASLTTLEHTDAILDQQETIGGGVLDGHIDGDTIIWIGHSRGGEGVARAYDRIFDGAYVPDHYTLDDIKLISSIAPTDFLGTANSNPHGAVYHLLYGAADGDVCGCPNNDIADSFNVYERATGYRQATYIQGADHNDFNCCGFEDFSGPPGTAIGRDEAQRVAKAVYLALLKHYIDGNIPTKDLLWRQYERFRPVGVQSTTIVDSEYRDGPEAGNFVIDDYQTAPSTGVSSSGGAVSFNVANLTEGNMQDNNFDFTWQSSDPMNGMTRGVTATDTTKAVVFDWTTGPNKFYDLDIIPEQQDFSDDAYLSFRVCQGTRHPETTAELGDLTFTIRLVDANNVGSAIKISAYGGGVEEPYQRSGFGGGVGWQNEFETIRIRLTDFLRNGSGLDLQNIVRIRFRFGADYGSSRGRIAVDDIEITKD